MMRLDISQEMKMDQRMMLAPRMIQSMEILQLPLLALEARIEQEMLSNPMLELEEPEEIPDESGDEADTETDAESNSPEQVLLIKEDRNHLEDFERLNNLGNDYDDYLNRGEAIRPRGNPDGPDRKLEALHNTAAPTQTLNESLNEQWAFVECDGVIRKAGQVIIDFIDDAGYLRVALEKLCDQVQPKITLAQISEALKLVQTLEPAGVGARNLPECLILQLNGKAKDYLLEIEIITHHLKDLEMNRYPVIARKTGKSIGEITQAIREISRLDPRPGMQIGRSETQYITPEIIVEYDHINDRYTTRLTSGTIPNIRLNPLYSKMIKTGQMSDKTKEFLQNNARSARWLIESIEQRKATLLRVVNHVVQNQREFMEKGSLYLKPLPMVKAAEALGIHVGTVSRAVSGKYIQTPVGIYPLRYFFSGGTETPEGESFSWDAVRTKLQGIIHNEDKMNPLSDDDLVTRLKDEGLTLARRTVAKYRNLLKIPPARRRKQYL